MKQALPGVGVLLAAFSLAAQAPAPQQPSPSGTPTIHVTSRLVFLDVTVLDKKGHPVVTGLTKDDFVITEEKKPQRIFSFEPPEVHTLDLHPGAPNPDGEAPRTILVVDLLNSSFEDFAYIRDQVRHYLTSRSPELRSPTELMLVGNQSLELLQSWTRNRADLLEALEHIPAMLPYKMMNGSFWPERLAQSVDALQQIAIQTQGVPGRKNILWVGHGMPSIDPVGIEGQDLATLQQYMHATTNLLVNSRVSLFVIYPGLRVTRIQRSLPLSAMDANADLGDDDPFMQGINFGVFANETGGKLFYNRNDVDEEMREARSLGSDYYTLTYQPHDGNDDGRFRRIRVTLRNPNLRALTKTGYFAPDKKAAANPQVETVAALSEAVYSTIPLQSIDLFIGNLARHPDTQTAQFTIFVGREHLDWLRNAEGTDSLEIGLAGASLDKYGKVLASRLAFTTASAPDAEKLGAWPLRIPFTLRTPRKTQSIRVVVETRPAGRMGSAEVDRKAIESAPALTTPEPQLSPVRPDQPPSTPPAP